MQKGLEHLCSEQGDGGLNRQDVGGDQSFLFYTALSWALKRNRERRTARQVRAADRVSRAEIATRFAFCGNQWSGVYFA